VSFTALDPVHYERHRLKPHHAARESLSYMLQLPEEGLAGFVYTWVNRESRAGAALCFYGPAIGEQPLFLMVDDVAVPEKQSFADWRVGDLELHHGETTTGRFAGNDASIEFSFQGVHPAYNYGSHPDGPLPWMADDRYEQSGRWQGYARLRGREIAFDTISHRDQSWGIRDWGMCQHYRWLQANAGPEYSVNFTQDVVLGHVNVRGYVYRDGEMAQVTGLECDYELDPDMVHTSFDAVIEDDAGRTTTVRGTTYANMEFPFPPTTTLVVCSEEVEIQGQRGTGQFDLLWASQYVEHVREHGLPALPGHRLSAHGPMPTSIVRRT
jgi:hypothetical protein